MEKRFLYLPFLLILLGACPSPPPAFPGGTGGAGGGGWGDGGSGGAPGQRPECPPLTRFEIPACGETGCWETPLPAPLDVERGAQGPGSELWLAGRGTAPLRWDGAQFHLLGQGLPSPAAPVTAFHLGGGVPHLVQGGRVYRLEGELWTEVDRGPFAFAPNAIWADEETLWLAGSEVRRNDGRGWESLPVVGYGPFHALWGAEGGMWAAGAKGAVFRWQDGAWQNLPSGTQNSLRSIWGSSMEEVWIGGEAGTLLRFSGEGFYTYDLRSGATILSIAGRGPDDVLALGYDASTQESQLFHWNGYHWRKLPPTDGLLPLGLWPSEEGVWVGGAGAALGLWTGECLRVKPSETAFLHDLWAGAWAVGEDGLLLHRTSEGWKRRASGTEEHLRSVWGWGDEVWVAGDGGTLLRGGAEGFRPVLGAGVRDLVALHGSEGGPLWIGARDGSIFRSDGRSLRRTPTPSRQPVRSLLGFGQEGWATTEYGEVWRWTGERWRFERRAFGRPELFGTSPDDVWLAGFDGGVAVLEHWDGSQWRIASSGGATTVYALAGDGEDLYVGHAPGVIRHWDGEAWTAHHLGLRPRALAVDGEDLWILAERSLHRWRGGVSIETHSTTAILTALHVEGGEVWVGTASGAIGRLGEDGLAFGEPVSEQPIRSIHGEGEELWAVGDAGTLLRFDGAAWQLEPLGTEAQLRAVRVSGDRVWVASSEGLLYRRDGAWHWFSGSPSDLTTLATTGGLVYVASAQGGLYAIDPNASGILYTIHPTLLVNAIWPSGGGTIWYGGVPMEDGTHFLRFDGEENERIDLGVTLAATAATALARGEAIVAREEEVFVMDTGGRRRSLPTAFGSIRAFSRQEGPLVPAAIGSTGGVLRLDLLESAPSSQ